VSPVALSLGNVAGLWALLALPVLVAIHFFQQRSRRVTLSTRFLIEALSPESQGGRTWERFRASRAFWMQALAVLLLTWVLAEPRWPRADSVQTVVLVLDDALAMQAVEREAREAALRLVAEEAGRAAQTEWVVMGSNPRAPLRYRGFDRSAAEASVAAWRPGLGTHDYAAALRGGRALANAKGDGVCWFITDREDKVPVDQPAVGVGRVLANVGFAGSSLLRTEDGGGWSWRAVVRNSSGSPQRRTWWIESTTGRSEPRSLELPADAVLELGGAWPAGADRAVLRLEEDGFAADDLLPLVRPESKRLRARTGGGETGAFFKRLFEGIDGVVTIPGEDADLRVTRASGANPNARGAAIVLPVARAEAGGALVRAPIVAERNALVAGLNWQGLLGPGPAAMEMGADDEALLWQADKPLMWLGAGEEGRRPLVFNVDWENSNVARLPATVLLLRRHVEAIRDAQPGLLVSNFDAGAVLPLANADLIAEPEAGWTLEREGQARRPVSREELAVLRAPWEAGFFALRRGETVLIRGAAQFADARQGDFRGASTFRRDPPEAESRRARARATQGDPWAAGWLALAAGALLASWWPARTGAPAAVSSAATSSRVERRRAAT